jgi:hypothetical protein
LGSFGVLLGSLIAAFACPDATGLGTDIGIRIDVGVSIGITIGLELGGVACFLSVCILRSGVETMESPAAVFAPAPDGGIANTGLLVAIAPVAGIEELRARLRDITGPPVDVLSGGCLTIGFNHLLDRTVRARRRFRVRRGSGL